MPGDDRVALNLVVLRSATSAEATNASDSSSARSHTTSSVSLPFVTLRYGVIRKPYSSTEAYIARLEMRPMFVPSGVSIGQMRP